MQLASVVVVDPMAFLPPTIPKAGREGVRGVDETAEVADVMMASVRPVPGVSLGSARIERGSH